MPKSEKSFNSDDKQKALKANLENEKIKNKYFAFLRDSKGYSEGTIEAIKKAIFRYEEFTDFEDYRKYNIQKAKDFKVWIENRTDTKGKKISLTTCYHYLRHLRDFFNWLSFQAGYKTKISATDSEYLRLSKEKSRQAIEARREDYPTIEQIQKVVSSIEINNEIDMRDRALISFTLLSGMRDLAITTLPIGCFNELTLEINQSPAKGVKTKFSKAIPSFLFRFDENMLNYILEWTRFLKEEKLFGNKDPLFPASKIELAENSKVFTSNSIEAKFWKSVTSMRDIFKQRFEDAGIPYFPPHSFRHLAVITAIGRCRNGEEIKAVSQNFGHENVGTTMITYGSLTKGRVREVITSMSFLDNEDDLGISLKDIEELLKKKKGGGF